ncbi:MAG: hypothetical protein ACYTAU_06895 [Planctomycetota bacterium]
MTRDRLIQGVALAGVIGGTAVCGSILPRLTETSQRHMLRYTDVAVEGAPPAVALGTAIGAVRGLIVDYLWIKVHLMKQEGLYYEVMADADLITKLQPRFSAVWAFHGHNMAYNISVAHNTEQERWEWVRAGIDLVRNKGLRYNPNDLQLHRELAFWFAHKIEGVADDAHLFYKRELAREWHGVLGEPPYDHEARIAWIKKVADAPDTPEDAQRRTPGVTALVDRLREELAPYEQQMKFSLDSTFLKAHSEWEALRQQSKYAQLFQFEQKMRANNPVFVTFDGIASDPELQEAWDTLLAHVRKRVLLDEYNMDPQLMYEYTRDFGPIDWRHGQAHALYWVLTGSEQGEQRVAVSEEDVYRIVNNDRMKLQAMQGLARWGRVSFDPFSTDWVSRFPDPRWIEVIDRYWEEYSGKHEETRGPGVDLFKAFHENFLSSSVRELYRSGQFEAAQHYLDRLNFLYGTNNPSEPNIIYSLPLDIFVRKKLEGEVEQQPHIAPSEVAASLRAGFLLGYGGRPKPEIFRRAVAFANDVTSYFKFNKYNDFLTKMGSSRLGALIGQLESSVYTVLAQLMIDTTVPLDRRLMVWRQVPDEYKVPVYDDIYPHMVMQIDAHPLGQLLSIDEALPAPVGLEEFRRQRALEELQREQDQPVERSEVERR